jgi:uncharacterized protein (DUF1800 family)
LCRQGFPNGHRSKQLEKNKPTKRYGERRGFEKGMQVGFSPELAEHRFGYGLSPQIAAPPSRLAMLAALAGPDHIAQAYPIPDFRTVQDRITHIRRFSAFARENPDTTAGKDAAKTAKRARRALAQDNQTWFATALLRRIETRDGLRERLVAFWGDHFTAQGKNGLLRKTGSAYLEEAVRPHLNADFATLLTACVTHPLMLHYLDQNTSAGPNSRAARRQDRRRGLNENLAREVLELHTLGVDGPYGQGDVRQLAELLTGLAATRNYGFKFRRNMAEPGGETVLGKTYDSAASLAPIRAVLSDLARHPATADHIARKLAVHFISDQPSPDLVAHIRAAYLASDGTLSECYAALLDHPDAWAMPARNIRPPEEFISASLRALAIGPAALDALRPAQLRQMFLIPLRLMGQDWQHPAGPDGWPEADNAWITPQGIAARLEWAVNIPARLRADLPDPRVFVQAVLGPNPPPEVVFAAQAAETRSDAIGLILCSPAFQRR